MSHNEFIGDPEAALAAAKRAQKKAAAAPEYQDEMGEAREARSAFTDQERAEAESFIQPVKDENALRHKKETQTKLKLLQERKKTARSNASSPTKGGGGANRESCSRVEQVGEEVEASIAYQESVSKSENKLRKSKMEANRGGGEADREEGSGRSEQAGGDGEAGNACDAACSGGASEGKVKAINAKLNQNVTLPH